MLKNFINNILNSSINFFKFINKNLNRIKNYINKNYKLNIISISYNEKGRFKVFILKNNQNLDHSDVIKGIYNTLMSSNDFLNFGEYKVIITSSLIDKGEFSFHHNVLLNNDSTLDNYYNSIIENVELYLDQGYPVDIIPTFKVRV